MIIQRNDVLLYYISVSMSECRGWNCHVGDSEHNRTPPAMT